MIRADTSHDLHAGLTLSLPPDRLEHALNALGDLLEHRGLSYDLVVVGASAMVLGGITKRTTEDIDVVGHFEVDRIRPGKPFPTDLQASVEEVGRALGLPLADEAGKDWLNPGPAMLVRLGGLPPGFMQRLTRREFGPLTLRIAARIDLVYLKLLSATDPQRERLRRGSDLDDLRTLAPTRDELRAAARWVLARDGRPETFHLEIRPVLQALGHDMESVDE